MSGASNGGANPFPKLTAEARETRDPRLTAELVAYLESAANAKPKSKKYDFYEYIGEKKGDDA